MPMGIVSDADFDDEIAKTSVKEVRPKQPVPTIVDYSKGRGNGNIAVPDSLRKIIGEESIINGRESAVQLAQSFGISPSSVSAYAVGAHSTTTYDKPADGGHINGVKQRVIKRAHHKLSLALKSISPEKLADAKVRDLAGIAKDMSVVIKNMEPDNAKNDDGKVGPQFVIYAPQFRDERNFEVVVAKDNI
jgi:hypothetical protein